MLMPAFLFLSRLIFLLFWCRDTLVDTVVSFARCSYEPEICQAAAGRQMPCA